MDARKGRAVGAAAALCSVAAFLRFAMRGYDVIAYLLAGTAALVVLKAFVGGVAFKVATGLAGALALAVCLTEVPIAMSARTDAPDDTRYVVVLGARVNENGEPSLSLLYRLQAALEFLEAHPDATAVLSGGQGPDEPMTEAACMRDWLVARGVDPARLVTEEASTNTGQNLEYSIALIRELGADPTQGCAVVSSSYHLYRAKLLAEQLGVQVSGIWAYPGNPVVALNYFIREAPAVWRLLLLGR